MIELYTQQIKALSSPSFDQINQIAKSNCGSKCPCRPWSVLNHGVGLLDSHEKLCKYICAYGKMHQEKLQTAFMAVSNEAFFSQEITIIDWGCGQGLASICFFDFLKEKNLPNNVKKVILIEPSAMALERSKLHVDVYMNDETKIVTVEKYLDDVVHEDIAVNTSIVLHFFSNILDIPSVNIDKLGFSISNSLIGTNYFFCVGPLNTTSTRIEDFAKSLNVQDEQLIDRKVGKLTKNRGTIKTLVFKLKGKEIEIIKTIFYPPISNNINYITMIEKIIKNIDVTHLDETDRIIEYFKTVIELERLKEPKIERYYEYPIDVQENFDFILDLTKNSDFIKKFNDNKNPAITPNFKVQDLYIGMNATLDKKSYNVLNYIIPFNDFKDIDPLLSDKNKKNIFTKHNHMNVCALGFSK